jgi:hypothetical protein
MKVGDKIYRYCESSPEEIDIIDKDNFGVITDMKTEIWVHPHNGDEYEKFIYTIRTNDGEVSEVEWGNIIRVDKLWDKLFKRKLQLESMCNILLDEVD